MKSLPPRHCAHCGCSVGTIEPLPGMCLHADGRYTCSADCRAALGLRTHWADDRCSEPCVTCGTAPDVREANARAADPRRIGARMRELRTRRGLTAAAVAKQIGIARPNYCRCEAGRHQQTLSVLERFCSVMGIALAELFAESTSSRQEVA